jgi:SpoVK/Ycf46/Vps4 family AAA+-type ATPase
MSEENMRKAIIQAESISPCVLWIDEIEKALAGVGGSGGSAEVTTRIFGSLLTWMQEKKNMVFVIATSNNISNMPPEFLRKGRFDEIFFVDFPDKKSRREIIEIHLRKRGKDDWINKIKIEDIVNSTEGFAGSDLEALIAEIVEDAFIHKRNDPNINFVSERVKNYIPLSKSIKNEIEDMKKRCQQYNFINVD